MLSRLEIQTSAPKSYSVSPKPQAHPLHLTIKPLNLTTNMQLRPTPQTSCGPLLLANLRAANFASSSARLPAELFRERASAWARPAAEASAAAAALAAARSRARMLDAELRGVLLLLMADANPRKPPPAPVQQSDRYVNSAQARTAEYFVFWTTT